jgi:O-antigen/teichoic acid export membrane protein
MAAPQAHTAEVVHGAGGQLERQLFAGIAWTAVFRWVAQFFSWIGTFYAAHLLAPGDFGVVAMAMVPIGFLRIVEDFGLDAVLVQDRNLDRKQLARLAGLATVVGVTFCGLFLLAARPIATFNHEPVVAALVSALSVTFILDSLQILPRATMQRELRFRTLAAVTATQFLVSAATLVTCAKLGLGYWALVLNAIVSGVVVTLILIRLAPYPIAWPREIRSLARPMLAGWRVLVSRAGWYGYSNMDQLLIGRVLGKDALGAYGFAMTFAGLPLQEITSVVSRVVPGVFSEVQANRTELRRYFLLLTEAMAYLALPAAIGLALTADRVVHIALGPRWEAVILPFRILCLYYAVYAAQVLVSHVLIWTGHFRANMWLTLLGVVGLGTGFAITVKAGIVAVAWTWVIAFPLLSVPALILAARLLDMRIREFFAALVPAALACVVMAIVVITFRAGLTDGLGDVPALALEAAVGAVTYAVFLAGGYRRRVFAIARTVFGRGG